MKKADVKIGETYVAKVSNKLVPVRIISESQYGGWNGLNTKTNREIGIRSAAKLRRVYRPKPDLFDDSPANVLKRTFRALYFRVPVSAEQTEAMYTLSSLMK